MGRALEDLNISMLRAAAAAAAMCFALAVIDFLTLDGNYAFAPHAAALLPFAAAIAWVIEGTVRRPLDRRPIRALTLVALTTLLVQPWLLGTLVPTVEYPPSWHLIVVGIVAGVLAFGARSFAVVALVGAGGVALARSEQGLPPAESAGEAALFLLTCCAAWLVSDALNRTAVQIGEATTELWQFHELAATERLRESERNRMDAIVHDRVLAALLLAGRGSDDAAAAAMAEQAIRGLEAAHADSTHSTSWAGLVRAAGERLGLGVEIRTHGTLGNDRPGEAITDATLEALRNVARHSGQGRVVVHARFTPRLARVTVSDPGVGFDVTAVTGRSTGISTSIRARLEDVGGQTQISSIPGQGTRVVMSVPRARFSEIPPAAWSRSRLSPIVFLAGLAAICHGVLGVANAGPTPAIWVVAVGTAVIVGLLTVAWSAPHTRSIQWALCSCVLLLAGVLATTVHDPMRPDWQWWFVGALDGVIAIIAFRFSGRAALITAALVPVVIVVVTLVMGARPSASAIADASTQLLVFALLGALIRRGFGRARARIGRITRARFEARRTELAIEARALEADERREALGSVVVPTLRSIAHGRLGPQEKAAALRLEAAVRDVLVARRILDPALAELLDRTRRRGVRVELAIAARIPDDLVADLRNVLRATLPTVPVGSLVRATWQDSFSTGAEPARVVLILPDATAARGQLAAMRSAHVDELVELRTDEELLILTVLGTPRDSRQPCPC